MNRASRGVHLAGVLVVTTLFALSATFLTPVFAVDFGPDVLVNHVTAGDQEIQDSGAIAVHGENVYIIWSDTNNDTYGVYVSRSTDGGATFDDGVPVEESAGQFFPTITVDDQGAVYAAWTIAEEGMDMPSGIAIAKSVDGGTSFSAPLLVSPTGAFPQVAADGGNVYLFYFDSTDFVTADFYFSRSLDGGATFQPSIKINDAVPLSGRFEDMAAIFVDDAGIIYVAWNDGRVENGGINIFLASSTDHGASFGPNVPVNSIDGATGDTMCFGPAIAASGSNVYVAWRDATVQENQRIMFARSVNGGVTFGPALHLDDPMWKSPAITLGTNGDIYVAAASGMGLYCVRSTDQGASFPESFIASSNDANDVKSPSIAWGGDGRLYAAWTDMRAGTQDIYASSGSMTTTAVDGRDAFPEPRVVAYGNHPNPFNAQTTIRYELTLPATVRITVFNALGQTVDNRDLGVCPTGMHEYRFDASSMTSGIYMYRVETGYGHVTGRMLYMK